MQLHQPSVTPTQLALYRAKKRRERDNEAASYERKLALVADEMAKAEQWPAPAPYPPRQWFFIEEELPTPFSMISAIRKAVAQHYGITRAQIMSPSRVAKIVLPRQVAMFLSRKITNKSLPEIGRRFGGRDHTTVLHAVRTIERLSLSDPKIASDIQAIRLELAR